MSDKSNRWIKVIKQPDGVARLTLNRPEKRNALNKEMMVSITEQLFKWSGDDSIHALILDASGSCFCAGADIEWMQRATDFSYEENVKDAKVLGNLLELLYHFPRPVITLVHGSAYGGALGIIAASDITLAKPDAVFCLSEVRIGLIPAVISPYIVQAIGLRQARRYTLSAETISAHKAQTLGLIHEVIEEQAFSQYSEELIKNLRNGSPESQGQTKALLRYVNTKSINPQLVQYTAEMIAHTRTSRHGQEGTTAFLEKRKPSWCL